MILSRCRKFQRGCAICNRWCSRALPGAGHSSSAPRIFWTAVSRVNRGSGGRESTIFASPRSSCARVGKSPHSAGAAARTTSFLIVPILFALVLSDTTTCHGRQRASCSPSAADGKFELIEDHSQRTELRQEWLPVGGDRVAQQPDQRPAVILGQVERAFRLERVTTTHPKYPLYPLYGGLPQKRNTCVRRDRSKT